MFVRSLGLFLCCAAFGSCRTLTKLDADLRLDLPDQWTTRMGATPKEAADGWLKDLRAEGLHELIETALRENRNLQTASARVRQAEARARAIGAERMPWVSSDLGGNRRRRLSGDTSATNSFDLGLNFQWEIDLWGRMADERAEAAAEFAAAENDALAARLSLSVNVAKTAFLLLEATQQGELSARNLDVLQKNLAALESRLVTELPERVALEIALSRADVHRAEANVAASKRLADAASRRLEVLIGRYPAGLVASPKSFPAVRRDVPVGLPSGLLLRRPDLLAAEQRVFAASKGLSASRKALLPSLHLSGGASSASDDLGQLLNREALLVNLAGRFTQQIFQGGRLRANIDLSAARRDELLARYAEVALQAFREVETSLAAEAYFHSQQQALESASQQAETAQELASANFERGLTDIITVLESTRRAFDARSNLLAITNQRLQNRLDLYLALGGDFDHSSTVQQ